MAEAPPPRAGKLSSSPPLYSAISPLDAHTTVTASSPSVLGSSQSSFNAYNVAGGAGGSTTGGGSMGSTVGGGGGGGSANIGEMYRNLSQRKGSLPDLPNVKLCLIGNSGVGKTSIKDRFDGLDFGVRYIATVGTDLLTRVLSIPVDDSGVPCDAEKATATRPVKCMLWDTAGQERYSALQRSTLRNCTGVIFVYDVTDAQSFESISKTWLVKCREECPDARMLLIGNKIDLADDRQVAQSVAKLFAKRECMYYYETSAKTGENVMVAVETFATIVCRECGIVKATLAGGSEKPPLGDSRAVKIAERRPLTLSDAPPPVADASSCAC
jgi:small GTP-binding protein